MDAVSLLALQLDEAYDMIHGRIDGLTDDEFWWEPAPLTTIGWRLVHVAECKVMYHEYAFGPGRLEWPDIDSAHSPQAATAQLEEGQQRLVEDLQSVGPADLERSVMTNWGEQWPAWKIFRTMIHHDIHHGAEIGALRDLYRVTRGAVPLGHAS
jgi:hypothetical protein